MSKAVLNLLSIPSFSVISFHRSEVNRLPLSVMRSQGILCNVYDFIEEQCCELPCIQVLLAGYAMTDFAQVIDDH